MLPPPKNPENTPFWWRFCRNYQLPITRFVPDSIVATPYTFLIESVRGFVITVLKKLRHRKIKGFAYSQTTNMYLSCGFERILLTTGCELWGSALDCRNDRKLTSHASLCERNRNKHWEPICVSTPHWLSFPLLGPEISHIQWFTSFAESLGLLCGCPLQLGMYKRLSFFELKDSQDVAEPAL